MDAIILAAGRGKRLRPLTDTLPKPLIEIENLSLIEIHLIHLASAGFKRIIINLHHLGEMIRRKLGTGERYGLHILYSDEPGEALETAGGIVNALDLINSSKFAVISADVLCDFPLRSLLQPLPKSSLGHLVLVANPTHHLIGDFELSDNGMLALREDKKNTKAYTYSGIAWFDKALFTGRPIEKLALRPVLETAIKNKQITGEYHAGLWSDIGSIERLNQAQCAPSVKEYIDAIKLSTS